MLVVQHQDAEAPQYKQDRAQAQPGHHARVIAGGVSFFHVWVFVQGFRTFNGGRASEFPVAA